MSLTKPIPQAGILALGHSSWSAPPSSSDRQRAAPALEAGGVLLLEQLPFPVEPDELALFAPELLGRGKNTSFDPATGCLGGTTATGRNAEVLRHFVSRFSDAADVLVAVLLPAYAGRVRRGRASFRPAEIAGRVTSWRRDDTRLHVDSFPATPVHGARILRVFTNVNPEGRARSWRIGGDFDSLAHRFAPSLRLPLPGSGRLLSLLRITRTPRSPYDALMLQLHDRMKLDDDYQRRSPQTAVDFPAGATWITFTDQVSHAAMAGQYQLEQTFLVPVDAMADPERSPLRVLERIKRRRLV